MVRLKQRIRNKSNREAKSIVVICCEGKNKSETTYLRNYSSRNCIIKFSTGTHTDPVGMAKDLISFMERENIDVNDGDKSYLLIDTDINQNKQEQVDEAKEICREKNIELITSTPTFEYWYLLHFGYSAKTYSSSKQVKAEIQKYIEGYSEKMDVYPIIKSMTDTAIENAEKVEEYHTTNGKEIDNEGSNPHTSIYKVVQELRKRQ